MLNRRVPKIVDAEARRQDVVEAVLRIIAVDGLERASLREVADEAGLAVGSVRHYFAGSDELLLYSFTTVVKRIVGRLEAALPAVHARTPNSPAHRAAVLTLLSEFLPLDEQRAMDACAWAAFRNAARIRPFLAGVADRSPLDGDRHGVTSFDRLHEDARLRLPVRNERQPPPVG